MCKYSFCLRNLRGSELECTHWERSVGRMRKKLPIGIDGFEKIRTNDFYYADKTMFISELLHNWGEVNLFTRPRRFGKTLNLSMIRRFFELERDEEGIKTDNSYIFQDLRIACCQEICRDHQQKYPVIALTMKSARQPDFQMARDSLKQIFISGLLFQMKRYGIFTVTVF